MEAEVALEKVNNVSHNNENIILSYPKYSFVVIECVGFNVQLDT